MKLASIFILSIMIIGCSQENNMDLTETNKSLQQVAAQEEKVVFSELVIKPDILGDGWAKTIDMNFNLPEFNIYNSKGARVYHQVSLAKDFELKVSEAMSSSRESEFRLENQLSLMLTTDGNEIDSALFEDYDFVFVEYWAEWCAPCFKQMKDVEVIISKNKQFKIIWLKVERDPNKVEGVDLKLEKV